VRFLSPHPNFDNAWIVLDKPADRLPTQPPDFREFPDPVVFLETRIIDRHLLLLLSESACYGFRERLDEVELDTHLDEKSDDGNEEKWQERDEEDTSHDGMGSAGADQEPNVPREVA
jgi:hypothetical protein